MSQPLFPTAFALVWDPRGDMAQDLVTWAQAAGASQLAQAGPVRFFGLGASDDLLQTWSDDHSTGVLLGEIYRAEEVPSAAAADPVSTDFGRRSTLAAVYARWGTDLFTRAEGVYGLALWDRRASRLVLYRDGSAAKGLYWYSGGTWAAAATRLDVLVGLPGLPKSISQAGLHEYLRFLDISPPNTIVAGVHAIEPGVPAAFAGASLDYLGPVAAEAEPVPKSRVSRRTRPTTLTFDGAVDQLERALLGSIEDRLAHHGPTGVFLSGGIDSALICALAARVAPGAVEAFTLGFAEAGFDERPIAAAIAEHLAVRHHTIAPDMTTYAEAFPAFVAGIDLPFADPAGLPTLLLFEACREVADVALDGTGADTLVGVMPARHTRIATQYTALLPRRLRLGLAELLRHVGLGRHAPILDFDAPEDLLIRWKGWSRAEIETLCGTPVDLSDTRFFHICRQYPRGEHLERYSALLANLPDDRIHQASELTGLRVRFPYGDTRVTSLVKGLPVSYRYSEAEPKRLLRGLLERHVPRALWDVPKHGFDFPFVALLRHDAHALVRQYLEEDSLAIHRLIDRGTARSYANAFRAGDDRPGFRIWALVVLSAWLEHHDLRH